METCFSQQKAEKNILITPVNTHCLAKLLQTQSERVKTWLQQIGFAAKPHTHALVADEQGNLQQAYVGCHVPSQIWDWGALPFLLPAGQYSLADSLQLASPEVFALAWGLGSYQYQTYKQAQQVPAQLYLASNLLSKRLQTTLAACYWVRDLINTPTEDMGPEQLAVAVNKLAKPFSTSIREIKGDKLLKHGLHLIHAVGRASSREPRLIELQWGDKQAPKLTLIGKGVCFDSGGMNLKSDSAMRLMKKDMAGAAHAMALAQLVMAEALPVRLRLLIPAVENLIASNAFKPGDVIRSAKGISIEIDNTDAEGRLILADALSLAMTDEPDLVIDFATLTGAAKVALGNDLPALFCNDDQVAAGIIAAAQAEADPVWRMPLYTPYEIALQSSIADISNCPVAGTPGGAIIAALFLQKFLDSNIPWAHFDFMAWNKTNRPGRPEGGEAMALRAVFAYLCQRYR